MPFEKRHHVFRKKIWNTVFRTGYVSYIQGLRKKKTEEEVKEEKVEEN